MKEEVKFLKVMEKSDVRQSFCWIFRVKEDVKLLEMTDTKAFAAPSRHNKVFQKPGELARVSSGSTGLFNLPGRER